VFFFQNKVHYLGHVITEEGVTVDSDKIKSIMDWPTPRDVYDIRSFMGPNGVLQKKGVKFVWTIEYEESFHQLKHLLTNALVLKIVDPRKDFLVCTNACKEGLEGVLMQEVHVICYESRKLNEHEINYVTHDLELDTIVHALKMWRHCLLG
jgi:hypothetical protein